MTWIKKNLIYKPDGSLPFSRTHAQVPFGYPIADKLRVYFSTRDENSSSAVSFVELNPDNLSEVTYVHNKPCLSKGAVGMFDETGTMPSWFLPVRSADGGDEIWLYYTGWNKSETASYRLGIGLAISRDGGLTFERKFTGPLLDRYIFDQVWVAQPCVMREEQPDGSVRWRMWYLSCTKIEVINGHPEPFYDVKYAESTDGIHWERTGHVCVGYDEFTDAIGRPTVYKDGNLYKMYFSYRNALNYRTDVERSYRIGYAESTDGITWERKDELAGIERSVAGWDSLMMDYCHIFSHRGEWVMFYNGNGFGASGFGYATQPSAN
ncbi:glycoside hydrolase family protein [Spirosoma areae]